jgi:hypothetical protein
VGPTCHTYSLLHRFILIPRRTASAPLKLRRSRALPACELRRPRDPPPWDPPPWATTVCRRGSSLPNPTPPARDGRSPGPVSSVGHEIRRRGICRPGPPPRAVVRSADLGHHRAPPEVSATPRARDGRSPGPPPCVTGSSPRPASGSSLR